MPRVVVYHARGLHGPLFPRAATRPAGRSGGGPAHSPCFGRKGAAQGLTRQSDRIVQDQAPAGLTRRGVWYGDGMAPSSQDVLFPGAGGRLRRGVLKRGLRYLGDLCWSKRARPALGRRGNSAEPPGKIADLGAAAGDDRRQPVLDCLHLVIT